VVARRLDRQRQRLAPRQRVSQAQPADDAGRFCSLVEGLQAAHGAYRPMRIAWFGSKERCRPHL